MSMIEHAHVEWAVVDRLGKLLLMSHEKYNVTQAYALFMPILCWTVQRLRKSGRGEPDSGTGDVLTQLQKTRIGSPPRLFGSQIELEASTAVGAPVMQLEDGLAAATAERVLIALRNTCAHGDERRIWPINGNADDGTPDCLLGFSFDCEVTDKDGDGATTIWSGTIRLKESNLRAIGTQLATMFCASMRSLRMDQPDFEAIAHGVREAA